MKLLVSAVALLAATQAQAVTITFDDLAANIIVADQYAALGVTFSAYEEGTEKPLVVAEGFGAPTNHLANVTASDYTGPRHDIVRLDFSGPLATLSLFGNSFGGFFITLSAYNADGKLVETKSFGGDRLFQEVTFSKLGITRLEALQPRDDYAFGLDDISFTFAERVPEPASLALLGLGVLGIAASRRRRG